MDARRRAEALQTKEFFALSQRLSRWARSLSLARPTLRETLFAGFVLVCVALAAAQTVRIASTTQLRWDATTNGLEWARFLGLNQDRYAAALGADASPADRRAAAAFFELAFRDGRIYHVETFGDPDAPTLAYGLFQPGRLGAADREALGAPDVAAATGAARPAIFAGAQRFLPVPPYAASDAARDALAAGRAEIVLHYGDGSTHPERFAEVVSPTEGGGAIRAVRVLVDLTDRASLYDLTGALAGLTVLAVAFALLAGPGAMLLRARLQQRRAVEDAIYNADHDLLTGALNRAGLVRRLDRALARDGAALGALHLDLLGFKTVNESLGHGAADRLLQGLVVGLRESVGPGGLVARVSGDEFIAVRGDVGDRVALERFAADAARAIGSVRLAEDPAYIAAATMGGALGPSQAPDAETLLAHLSASLRWAKLNERGRCVCYNSAVAEGVQARAKLGRYLREALDEDRFTMAFQPKFNAATERLTGFEALLRLRGRDGAPISPADFIPIAEEIGLIPELGGAALAVATRTAAGWPAPLKIAVNLSPAQLLDPELERRIDTALADSGLDPTRLEIEITESTLIENADEAAKILSRLRARGLTIALDDFGAGYSGLGHLWRFKFDRIKVDRSFLGGLSERPEETRYVLNLVAALGRTMNLQVTAEGVETLEQLTVVRTAGCDEIQGFLFGRPTPAEDLDMFFDADAAAAAKSAAREDALDAAFRCDGPVCGGSRTAAD